MSEQSKNKPGFVARKPDVNILMKVDVRELRKILEEQAKRVHSERKVGDTISRKIEGKENEDIKTEDDFKQFLKQLFGLASEWWEMADLRRKVGQLTGKYIGGLSEGYGPINAACKAFFEFSKEIRRIGISNNNFAGVSVYKINENGTIFVCIWKGKKQPDRKPNEVNDKDLRTVKEKVDLSTLVDTDSVDPDVLPY